MNEWLRAVRVCTVCVLVRHLDDYSVCVCAFGGLLYSMLNASCFIIFLFLFFFLLFLPECVIDGCLCSSCLGGFGVRHGDQQPRPITSNSRRRGGLVLLLEGC
jgi:hypothetical protein